MSDGNAPGQQRMWAESELPSRESATVPTPAAPKAPRFQAVNRQQMVWRSMDVERLVEPDHVVRAIWELTGRLDLTGFASEVRAVEGGAGRTPYDPRLLIGLWIFAYSQGISSAREVERRCEYHPAYQWLTGCEIVNYHTLSDFRVDHQEALDQLFAQLLAVLSREGLITLEQVVHDGTKVKASASRQSFHREKTLRAHLEAAQEQVRAMGDPQQDAPGPGAQSARQRAARAKLEKLEQALEEMQKVQAAPEAQTEKSERRVSETDPEARLMKQSDGGHAPRHNVQISTDVAHSIIVGSTVTQDSSDQRQWVPALEQVQHQTGRAPGPMIVEDGFTTRENILAAAERGVDLIGGTMQGDAEATARRLEKRGVDPAFYPQNFCYHPDPNTYTCPAQKVLAYRTTQHDRVGVERHVYRARAADCRACALRQACQPGKQGRLIVRTENVPTVAAYVAKMQTEAARAAYRHRAPVAEFTNAWRKAKLGLRQFCVRGLQKVRCEVLWACLTYNIQQGFRLRWKLRLMPTPV